MFLNLHNLFENEYGTLQSKIGAERMWGAVETGDYFQLQGSTVADKSLLTSRKVHLS